MYAHSCDQLRLQLDPVALVGLFFELAEGHVDGGYSQAIDDIEWIKGLVCRHYIYTKLVDRMSHM